MYLLTRMELAPRPSNSKTSPHPVGMSSFLLTVLSATVALSTAQPTECQPAIIGLSTALGISLSAAAAAALYAVKDRLCCAPGDRRRVYDTPCPYCQTKQPRDCMREHLTDCEEHRKFWTPRLRTAVSLKYTRPPRLSIPVVSPPKPASDVPPPTPPSV